MEVKADRRELPADPKALDGVTLRDLIEKYRDEVTPRKRRAAIETMVLNAFLRDDLCSLSLSALTSEHFVKHVDKRLSKVKPTTLKRDLGTIHHLFETAKNEWGLPIRENPLTPVLKRLAGDRRRERRLSRTEEEALLTSARKSRNRYVAPIIIAALETSMRRGEILAMTLKHLDMARKEVFIPESKNGHSRTVPLTDRAMVAIEKAMQVSDYGSHVFPVSANAFRLAWERTRKRAGLDDLHFHDLRHEAISRFFEMGLTIPEVTILSGHKDMRMLLRYAHGARQEVRRKLNGGSE